MEDGLLSAFGPPILAFERMVLGVEIPRSDKQGGYAKSLGGDRGGRKRQTNEVGEYEVT